MTNKNNRIAQDITSLWETYVNIETCKEDEVDKREESLQEAYKEITNLQLYLKKDKSGKLVVSGLESLQEEVKEVNKSKEPEK